MTQKTLKLNDDWDLFVDTKGDLSVTDKNSKNYAIAQNVANAFRLFTLDFLLTMLITSQMKAYHIF